MNGHPRFSEDGRCAYTVGAHRVELALESPWVFPPSESSLALAKVLLGTKAESALDIGTGSGILAIALALAGCRNVVALDINKRAVASARESVRLNGLEDSITVVEGDITSWRSHAPFDVVVANPPFMPVTDDFWLMNDQITLAVSGGFDGSDRVLDFARAARPHVASTGKYIFGLPAFANIVRARSGLMHWYRLRELGRRRIRYWLQDHSAECANHLLQLKESGIVQVSQVGRSLRSWLHIMQCTPLATV